MVDYPDFYAPRLVFGEAKVHAGDMQTFTGTAFSLAAGDSVQVINYTVPSDKNLYITSVQCCQYENAAGEAANYQAYAGTLYFMILSTSSESMSAVVTYPSPVRIDGGTTLNAYITNTGSATGNFYLVIVGYLD